MPKERNVPYVASGFREDAERLLNKFVARKSLKFQAFADEWRKLKFSLIFMGKENIRELIEFTEECYRNTLLFMNTSDPLQKVGAVYLLYSLYLKQPLSLLKVPVRIRMCQQHISELYQLESYFQDEALELKYIISKLFITEAIYMSCCPIPMGPTVPIPLLKLAPLRSSCFKDALGALSLFNQKEIKNITTITQKYERLKKRVPSLLLTETVTSNESLFRFKQLKQTLGELETRYNTGLLPSKVNGDVKLEDEFKALGQRRAYLKAQQYGKAAEVGQSRRAKERNDYTSSSSSSSTPVPVKRLRGRPKMTKNKGRKKKNMEVQVKQEFNVGSIVSCLLDEPGPSGVSGKQGRKPKKGPKPGRRHYFEDDEEE